MFGTNEVVGKKFFKDKEKLFVTSIFYTLQGEGPYCGMPSIFIRLAKCNLQCDFCDTWFDSGEWMTYEEIFNKIQSIMKNRFPLYDPEKDEIIKNLVLVITGGEPTLQSAVLHDFIADAWFQFRAIQIETNGILEPQIPYYARIVCSPKCVNGKYIEPHHTLLHEPEHDVNFKFVVSADPDSPYHSIPNWAVPLGTKVYISPMNMYKRQCEKNEVSSFWTPGLLDMELNRKNHEYAAWLCLEYGFRLSLQQHLYVGLA